MTLAEHREAREKLLKSFVKGLLTIQEYDGALAELGPPPEPVGPGFVEVEMPPSDGARYGCNLLVRAPKPVWWELCQKEATKAYREDGERRLRLRCDEHHGVPDRSWNG